MSSDPIEAELNSAPEADASRRQRFGLSLVLGVGLIAALVSFVGTRESWVTTDGPTEAGAMPAASVAADPAWDYAIPEGPHRAEFESSCLICHSARLPLGQPLFRRDKWAEIVHKMVAVYGAPLTPDDESHVVDYMLAARPPGL